MAHFNIKGVLCHVLCILIAFLPNTRTLRISKIIVPPFVDVRNVASLECIYEIGNRKLNSVKWYKNDKEFFRYAPTMNPNQNMIFPVDGVHVGDDYMCSDKVCMVHLDNLSNDSTGSFRCEVSGDAPDFRIVHETANMTIVALPKHDPKLEGLEQLYYVDDFLFGNCTSSFSYPPPNLAWYINDKKADNSFLQPFHEEIIEAYGLKIHQRSLELRFRINEKTIPYLPKKIRLRCTSQLTGMPSELRDSMHEFNVETEPELRNQKLINWKMSSAASPSVAKFDASRVLLMWSSLASLMFTTIKLRVNS